MEGDRNILAQAVLVGAFLIVAATLHGEWRQGVFEDLMAGTTETCIVASADVSQRTLTTPKIVVVDRGERFQVYINWGGYNMEPGTVTVRFDESPPRRWVATLSTSRDSSFITRTGDFIAKMLENDGEQLAAQAVRATGVSSVGLWDLTGIREAFIEAFGPPEGTDEAEAEEPEQSDKPGEASALPSQAWEYELRYTVTGTAETVDVVLGKPTGGPQHYWDVVVPAEYAYATFDESFLFIWAENQGETGTVTVRIYYRGELITESTSEGAHAIASASGSKP